MLIPCVIGAEEYDYLFYRGLSLYVRMNILLLKNSKGVQEVVLPNAKELSKIWDKQISIMQRKLGSDLFDKPILYIMKLLDSHR